MAAPMKGRMPPRTSGEILPTAVFYPVLDVGSTWPVATYVAARATIGTSTRKMDHRRARLDLMTLLARQPRRQGLCRPVDAACPQAADRAPILSPWAMTAKRSKCRLPRDARICIAIRRYIKRRRRAGGEEGRGGFSELMRTFEGAAYPDRRARAVGVALRALNSGSMRAPASSSARRSSISRRVSDKPAMEPADFQDGALSERCRRAGQYIAATA